MIVKILSKIVVDNPVNANQARIRQLYLGYLKFRRNKLAVSGLIIILTLILIAIFAPFIAPFGVTEGDTSTSSLIAPSATHLFGTDKQGWDLFSRVIYGSRLTILVVIIVSLIAPLSGMIIGIISGYFGGIIDTILMRITDVFLAFPKLILALAFAAALGAGIENAILAISITSWPAYARLARAESVLVMQSDYIQAVKTAGASSFRIIFLHIPSMCVTSVIVRATLDMSGIILTTAGLGFLGLGAQPPSPEWGLLVSDGRANFLDQWWLITFPGIAIFVVSLGFNFLGDGLRDVLDPKSK